MANASNPVAVQNLLSSFCCLFVKDISQHFSLLVGLRKSSKFRSHLTKNQKKCIKSSPGSNILASLKAGQFISLIVALSMTPPMFPFE